MTKVHFYDRPCGYGKTQGMIESLKPEGKYIIVTPYLPEVERIRTDALKYSDVVLHEPERFTRDGKQVCKFEHFLELVEDGVSIVTTHTTFERANSLDLSGYDVIIDEVFDVVDNVGGPRKEAWERVYLGDGYVTVADDGQVTPTDKWKANAQGLDGTLRYDLFLKAMLGRLYRTQEGYFVSAVPISLFTTSDTCTVMTFLAEQSLMYLYLKHFGVTCTIDRDRKIEREYMLSFKRLVEINEIKSLKDISFAYGQQEKQKKAAESKVSKSLASLKANKFKGVDNDFVFVSSNKSKWKDEDNKPAGYAKGSRFQTASFVPRTTKGTNLYKQCTHGIYLNDLNLSRNVSCFLKTRKKDADDWAVAEFFQWAYRGCIRDGQSMTLYVPSARMRSLVENFLDNYAELELIEAVTSGTYA